MLVEVKPLPKVQWHGKKGKDNFAVPKVIEVLYDHSKGKYATGLTEEEEVEYSKLLGVDLSAVFNPTEPHPYWPTKAAQITLPNYTIVFDSNKPQEYVKIRNLKASKFVANSIREYEAGEFPDATHVIYDEESEVKSKATKLAQRDEATIFKSKMSADDKVSMIQILSNKSVRGRSDDFLNVELSDIIEGNPEEFLRIARMGKEEVYNKAKILEATHKGVINKEASGYFWMGEQIGMDLDDAAKWFADLKNQKIKLSILERLDKVK